MDAISGIRDGYPTAVVKKCGEHKCCPKLRSLRRFVILKGEKLDGTVMMPDCVIFGISPVRVVGVIELKRRSVHANDIRTKLENALGTVYEIKNRYSLDDAQICLIVMSVKMQISERRRFYKPISYNGIDHYILTRNCGEPFPAPAECARRRRPPRRRR